jgi:putative membrane-bound dehydrogenase-like protein
MHHRFVQIVVLIVGVAICGKIVGQGFAPAEAVKRMTAANGLKVRLFASEPEVRQPIFVKCDDRGRLWTIQYLQYPNPAGLTRVKVDRWSRTIYDRVPEPPPRGPKGADRITILEDKDGDGHADSAKDFVSGLNLVTGVEFGHGGVFVLNVPYLLFYPDANHDDVPDGDPEVLLSGFGMEDAQSLSNHLTWGPDGWLYGVNGSTTTCRIRGIEFQQGVWRYHPRTHAFELFCEGGSNCYGVTFDEHGELFYSTNGGPFVHAAQGGYFYKSFGKHGPLHNLHAYHYFPELERDQAPGGPPTGGTVYLADALPRELRGAFIAGNFLGHTVSWWNIQPIGNTVRATYGGVLLDAHDTWFGPTDVCTGPDGSLFVSDFYDQRTAHPDPDANWDRSNGRIYKVAAADAKPLQPVNVAELTSPELVDLLSHSNHWFRARARIEMARRRDQTIVGPLREMATQTKDNQLALEGLWALHAMADIDEQFALQLLDHPNEYVRYWTVRFIGDVYRATPEVAERLIKLPAQEPSATVRGQLAASAKRLPARDGLRIAAALLSDHKNESDPRIPWLVWWAIESKAISDAELVLQMFAQEATWKNAASRNIALLLIRRYAAEGTTDAYEACLRLLRLAPAEYAVEANNHLAQGLAERAVGLSGIGQGGLFGDQAAGADGAPSIERRRFEPLTPALKDHIKAFWKQQPDDAERLELALRAEVADAYPMLKAAVSQPNLDASHSASLFHLLREFGRADVIPLMLRLVQSNKTDATRLAALDVLAGHENRDIPSALIDVYAAASPEVRRGIRDVLFARPGSALVFLQAVDARRLKAEDVPPDQLRRLAIFKHLEIGKLVHEHWGNIGPGSSEEKLATMRRFNNDLRAGIGDPAAGKVLFAKTCGVCHQLHGEGNKIGPDLTTANRGDRAALLANIVDPSAVIRREYMNYIVITSSGRVVTGLMADQDGASITILDANNQRTKIPRDEIDELREAEVSLMPERLLDPLKPQELRDLFAYLQDVSHSTTAIQQ